MKEMLLIFISKMALYAVAKGLVFWLYCVLLGRSRPGTVARIRQLATMLLFFLALWCGWQYLMTTPYDEWAILLVSIVGVRVAYREIVTVFGIRNIEWSRTSPEFCLVGWYDWLDGFIDWVGNGFSFGSSSYGYGDGGGGGSRSSRMNRIDEEQREHMAREEFYYDARWYYDYGDGRNG